MDFAVQIFGAFTVTWYRKINMGNAFNRTICNATSSVQIGKHNGISDVFFYLFFLLMDPLQTAIICFR
jgi:hypothetical protein